MIRFFRNRQKLLHQKKLGKYLLYALGEIILVVLGILIALQLNTWREQTRNKKTECIYLSSLSLDLGRQLDAINQQLAFEGGVIKDAEALINAYHESDRFIVDSVFSTHVNTLNNRFTFRISNSTYEELLSTGSMNIISSDTLKSQLLNYYQVLQRHESVITRNNLFVDNQFLPRALSLSTHRTPEHQAQMYESVVESGLIDPTVIEKEGNIERFAKMIERELSSPLKELEFLNNVQYRHRVSAVHAYLMLELKTLTEELLSEIDKPLKACKFE